MATSANKHVGVGPEKLCGRRLWNGQKLPRKAQSGPKNHLRGGETNSLLGSGQEPEDPGKLLAPGTINTGGPEGVLLGVVEPLDHPVTLGVVGSSPVRQHKQRPS